MITDTSSDNIDTSIWYLHLTTRCTTVNTLIWKNFLIGLDEIIASSDPGPFASIIYPHLLGACGQTGQGPDPRRAHNPV